MEQSVCCIILTKNEESNIARSVKSAFLICDRVFVVDSGSSDDTVRIAKENGAEVFIHEFITHGKQFNWALKNLNIHSDWIIRLDADEEITPEASDELKDLINKHKNDQVNGIVFRFKVYFLGKFLKHGGMYPFLKLCAFKNKKGYVLEEPMRDQTVLTDGTFVYMKKDCLHYDFKGLDDWVLKHNRYSNMELGNLQTKKIGVEDKQLLKSIKRTRKLRDGFYYRLPMFIRARLYYLFIIIFKCAFLDGRPGLIHAYLHTFWYRYLIDAKIYEQKLDKKRKK